MKYSKTSEEKISRTMVEVQENLKNKLKISDEINEMNEENKQNRKETTIYLKNSFNEIRNLLSNSITPKNTNADQKFPSTPVTEGRGRMRIYTSHYGRTGQYIKDNFTRGRWSSGRVR